MSTFWLNSTGNLVDFKSRASTPDAMLRSNYLAGASAIEPTGVAREKLNAEAEILSDVGGRIMLKMVPSQLSVSD